MNTDRDTAPSDLFGLAGTFPRPGWVVLDAARRHRFTGELTLDTIPATKIYLDSGQIYLAERVTDPAIGSRLVDAGALNEAQLEHGSMWVGEVAHLGRLFERVPSVDRDNVLVVSEMMTEECVGWLAGQLVRDAVAVPYQHHPAGVRRWLLATPTRDLSPGDALPSPAADETPVQEVPAEPLFASVESFDDGMIQWEQPSWLDDRSSTRAEPIPVADLTAGPDPAPAAERAGALKTLIDSVVSPTSADTVSAGPGLEPSVEIALPAPPTVLADPVPGDLVPPPSVLADPIMPALDDPVTRPAAAPGLAPPVVGKTLPAPVHPAPQPMPDVQAAGAEPTRPVDDWAELIATVAEDSEPDTEAAAGEPTDDWVDRLQIDGLPEAGAELLTTTKRLPPSAAAPLDRFEVIWPSGEVDEQFGGSDTASTVERHPDFDRAGPTARVGTTGRGEVPTSGFPPPPGDSGSPDLDDIEPDGDGDMVLAVRRAVATIETGSLAARRRLVATPGVDDPSRGRSASAESMPRPDELSVRQVATAAISTQRAPTRSVFDDDPVTVEPVLPAEPTAPEAPAARAEGGRSGALRRLISTLRGR